MQLSLQFASFPWLSSVLIVLALGAITTLILPTKTARWAALITQLITLTLSFIIILQFDNTATDFQLGECYSWISSINAYFQVGLDGISVLFLPFSALLFLAVLLGTWNAIRTLPSAYFALLLVFEISIIGVFIALDTLLFFLFWELSVLPLFMMTSIWGAGANRRYAAMKYALFMLVAGIPLLIAILILANQSSGWVFDYIALFNTAHHYPHQILILALLFLGFAVKIPVFPFHTWLPVIAQEGPAGILALLAGFKIGLYGLLRFAIPLAPDAAVHYKWLLVGLGMLGLLYGAVTALGQSNLRRMLAFASVSHVGLVLLGISSLNMLGIQGTLLQLLNFILITGGLYLLVEFIHQRTGSGEILSLGGLAGNMPVLVALFFLLSMASIGVPLTSGFPAEFLLITAVLKSHTGAGLVALFVVVLGAGYTLNAFRLTFLGKTRHEYLTKLPDLLPRELLAISLITVWVVLLGLYPQGVLDLMATSTQVWLEHLNP